MGGGGGGGQRCGAGLGWGGWGGRDVGRGWGGWVWGSAGIVVIRGIVYHSTECVSTKISTCAAKSLT